MVNVNNFKGINDSEIINNAINAKGADGIVLIPPREIDDTRNYWLLDNAILLPENTTVILQNCMLKLSDNCRDNFFRTANSGLGIEFPEKINNIHIKGEGYVLLCGADHPRATGDSSKPLANPCPYTDEYLCKYAHWIPEERRSPEKLDFWDKHTYSFGTDAGKEGVSQTGDWRSIGILFANTEDFSIENLHIKDSHGWGISLEACKKGRIEKIEFDAHMYKEIDGMLSNIENQDGIDIRNGCSDIIITDITGVTGDDVIALTAIAGKKYIPGGSEISTHVMHNDWTKRESGIKNIIIKNVIGYSHCCFTVRLLPCEAKIENVVIDGVIDNSIRENHPCATILLGEGDAAYGKNLPDSLSNVSISNVISNSNPALCIPGYLSNSMISNFINRNNEYAFVQVCRENAIKNVKFSNCYKDFPNN